MSGIVRTLTKRMASFSSLRDKASTNSTHSDQRSTPESHDTPAKTLESSCDESAMSEELTPPVIHVSPFDFGYSNAKGMVKTLRRHVTIRGSLREADIVVAPMPKIEITDMEKVVKEKEPAESEIWEILRGGKLSDRSPQELKKLRKAHMIDVEIDRIDPETVLPNLKELSVVGSTIANFKALAPLLPQLKDLWLGDIIGAPNSPRDAESRGKYRQELLGSLSAFVNVSKANMLNSFEISDVQFTDPYFHGYLRFVHKLSHLTFPVAVYDHRSFFQRPFVLQVTTVPKGFLQDVDRIERPVIEDIHAPGLRNFHLHVVGQFPKIRRFDARELKEVTLVLSSVGGVDMFNEFSYEDIDFLMNVKNIIFRGELSLLHHLSSLLRESIGGFSLEINSHHDEDILKGLYFDKAQKISIITKLGNIPRVNAPNVRNFTIIYQNPKESVSIVNLSSSFPLLETLEIRSRDTKDLAMKEPPLVTLQWMDRGLFSNLEQIHMSSRVRLDTGFFTHSFPSLKKAKVTTLSETISHGLSQWRTPLLEELELYVDYTRIAGEMGDVAVVVSGFRCLRELYVKGITNLVIENCPYLELINSRYAGPMKNLNVTGSYILRGLVYDSPGGNIVDNVIHGCDRFIREFRPPPRNYHLTVYDSFFSSTPTELDDDCMIGNRLG